MSDNPPEVQPSWLESQILKLRACVFDYKRLTVFLTPLVLIVLILIFKFSFSEGHFENDIISAKTAYAKWVSDDSLESMHFQQLKTSLKKYPELSACFEPGIVQKMIASGKEKRSRGYIENILKRLHSTAESYYMLFSKTTLSIERKDYEKALKDAVALKESMISDKVFWKEGSKKKFGSMLFAFNLIRIANLHQVLNNADEELMAWKSVNRHANWCGEYEDASSIDSDVFGTILSHYTDQNLTLKDYIKHREQTLLALKSS